jgi:serine/threonine protein kinase
VSSALGSIPDRETLGGSGDYTYGAVDDLGGMDGDGDFLPMSAPCGTSTYAAPEVYRQEHCSPAVDLWSFGVLLYVAVTGRSPWIRCAEFDRRVMSKSTISRRVIAGAYTPLPETLSPAFRDLIARLLVVDPANRITVAEASAHAWFRRHIPSLDRGVAETGTSSSNSTGSSSTGSNSTGSSSTGSSSSSSSSSSSGSYAGSEPAHRSLSQSTSQSHAPRRLSRDPISLGIAPGGVDSRTVACTEGTRSSMDSTNCGTSLNHNQGRGCVISRDSSLNDNTHFQNPTSTATATATSATMGGNGGGGGNGGNGGGFGGGFGGSTMYGAASAAAVTAAGRAAHTRRPSDGPADSRSTHSPAATPRSTLLIHTSSGIMSASNSSEPGTSRTHRALTSGSSSSGLSSRSDPFHEDFESAASPRTVNRRDIKHEPLVNRRAL